MSVAITYLLQQMQEIRENPGFGIYVAAATILIVFVITLVHQIGRPRI
jgi:hypothetical protein